MKKKIQFERNRAIKIDRLKAIDKHFFPLIGVYTAEAHKNTSLNHSLSYNFLICVISNVSLNRLEIRNWDQQKIFYGILSRSLKAVQKFTIFMTRSYSQQEKNNNKKSFLLLLWCINKLSATWEIIWCRFDVEF